MLDLDPARLHNAINEESERFLMERPRCLALHSQLMDRLVGAVPMGWMRWWPTAIPLIIQDASGAHLTDVDGHEYVDFCLGEGGAMAGHSPFAVTDAINDQMYKGLTHLFPTEDSLWVAEHLHWRFGLPMWHFALSASDANRSVIRLLRAITGRQVVVVFAGCYHGTVDEGLHTPAGEREPPRRMILFNDVAALEEALAPGDVACVLTEPVLTNVGLVFPQPGFHDALRELTRRTGTLLVIDETHTISAGIGGCTRQWNLEPDVLVVGKAIGGGIPIGAYGFTQSLAAQIEGNNLVDMEGTGGTLAGNALSLAATRATLRDIFTEENFRYTTDLAKRFAAGVDRVATERGLPIRTATLGCRVEYAFGPIPRTGAESEAALNAELSEVLRLHAINRGVILTPFLSNIALICPDTTESDVDKHTAVFAEALDDLFG